MAVAVAAGSAACSGGGAAGPSSAGSVANAPAGAPTGASGLGLPDLDPCSKLTEADVQALFSTPLGTSTTDHTGDCTWPLGDPSIGDGLNVVVNVGQGEGPLNDDMGTTGVTPISGIGDHATWDLLGGYFPHLGAVKGQDTCELSIAGGNGQLSVHTTGKGVFAAIDPTALPAFMQQFGALCNEIFAGIGP
jgi:hypothetical protein